MSFRLKQKKNQASKEGICRSAVHGLRSEIQQECGKQSKLECVYFIGMEQQCMKVIPSGRKKIFLLEDSAAEATCRLR